MTLLGWGGGANRASAGVEFCSSDVDGWMAIGGDGGNCVEFWMEVGDHGCPTSGLICGADGVDGSISRRLD